MAHDAWALAALIISFIVLIGAIALIIFGATRKIPPGPPCASTNQCDPTQTCTGGYCVQVSCLKESDCGPSQTCSNGFCYQNICYSNTDCGTGTVCQHGLCVVNGQKCASNKDCRGGILSCVNGICSQCATSVDCMGGICGSDGICYSNCSGVSNICPSGTTCINDFCCPTGTYPNHCSNPGDCGKGFCVNGACTCNKGGYGDICVSSTDCSSGICLGGICVNTGNDCFYNFDPNKSGPAHCPSGSPFCSNGLCSAESIGAPCMCFESGLSSNCTQFNSCNVAPTGGTGTTGSTGRQGATVTYCINNKCNLTPGWAGASCTSSFDCAPISGAPNCNNGTCM